MSATGDVMELVAARRGHFRLESGHHSEMWLDLDDLFSDTGRIEPLVRRLTTLLEPYEVSVVCGPLLGGAFLAQLIAHALGAEFWFTERVAPARADGLYGVKYLLPPALANRSGGPRVAIVDDVMSAGSALRATFAELRAHRAIPVVAAALLVLGTAGADYFAAEGIPVEAVGREPYDLWLPDDCPRCRAGEPLVHPVPDAR